MGLKSDKWIRSQPGMIEPIVMNKVRRGVLSYGTSSYGYDIRWAEETYVFVPVPGVILDPKNPDPRIMVKVDVQDSPVGQYVIIPPHSFALGKTVERFRIPANVLTVCVGKSSMARLGAILNVTPFEPGWHGVATLELTNSTPLPLKVYVNEGIGQILFFEGDEPCEATYGDGTYQNQEDKVVITKVNK